MDKCVCSRHARSLVEQRPYGHERSFRSVLIYRRNYNNTYERYALLAIKSHRTFFLFSRAIRLHYLVFHVQWYLFRSLSLLSLSICWFGCSAIEWAHTSLYVIASTICNIVREKEADGGRGWHWEIESEYRWASLTNIHIHIYSLGYAPKSASENYDEFTAQPHWIVDIGVVAVFFAMKLIRWTFDTFHSIHCVLLDVSSKHTHKKTNYTLLNIAHTHLFVC